MRRPSDSSIHKAWDNMKSRCRLQSNPKYRRYGGRGVVVCKRWVESFGAFASDMGPKPTSRHSIDRINNDGHYSCGKCEECLTRGWPANCRWATQLGQQSNRSDNKKLSAFGECHTVPGWSRRLNLNKRATRTLRGRIERGWSLERAVVGL